MIPSFSLDGWSNVITGFGRQAFDKLANSVATYIQMPEAEVEDLYAVDDNAAKIVDKLPEEALRKWISLEVGDSELASGIDTYLDKMNVPAQLEKAWKWARLYGGAAILINVDDGKELRERLEPKAIRKIRSFTVMSRHELHARRWDTDIESESFGLPLTYNICPRRGTGARSAMNEDVHRSRLIIFDGAPLPLRLEQQNLGWGDSVLTRAKSAVRGYAAAHDAAAIVMQEFNQGVFKMKGLADLLLQNDEDSDAAILKRLSYMNMARSVCRAVILDEDESFENKGAALSGVDKVLEKVNQRMVGASGMPHTKLLGESPSGLGATGESEMNEWYDFVESQQESILRPRIKRLLEIVFISRQGPTSGRIPANWSFRFNPLKQMSEKETAELRKTVAETDKAYYEIGVLDEDEIAESRFGGEQYSTETNIDQRTRKLARQTVEEDEV